MLMDALVFIVTPPQPTVATPTIGTKVKVPLTNYGVATDRTTSRDLAIFGVGGTSLAPFPNDLRRSIIEHYEV